MFKQYIMKNGSAVGVSDEVYKLLKKSDCRIKRFEKSPKKHGISSIRGGQKIRKHTCKKENNVVNKLPKLNLLREYCL